MATVRNDSQTRDRANAAAQRAKQMSPSIQYAIVQVLPNINNGAFWGFTDMKGIQGHIDAIRNSGGNITARQLGNACLIEVNPSYMVNAVTAIDPNAVTQKDVQVMTQKLRLLLRSSLLQKVSPLASQDSYSVAQLVFIVPMMCQL